MIIPPLQGKLNHQDFFIYGACDEHYFDDFGKSLINSIQKNTTNAVHIHLFNPRSDQLEFCQKKSVSVTYEYVSAELFRQAADKWAGEQQNPTDIDRKNRILKSMEKGKDASIIERMQKTYFACARFIRLKEILKLNQSFFAIDVDAVVRKNIPILTSNKDFYIHQVPGKKFRFLAGGLMSSGNTEAHQFLTEYTDFLQSNIANDYLYWGLDQDVLLRLVPKYKYGNLPMGYIDWEMYPDSYIWTAKGVRKDLKIFVDEQKNYLT